MSPFGGPIESRMESGQSLTGENFLFVKVV